MVLLFAETLISVMRLGLQRSTLQERSLSSSTQLKGYADEDRFYNKAGDRVRAYTLRAGDRVSLSENAFEAAPAVGDYVTYDADAKQYVVGPVANDKFCAQILSKIVRSNLVMYKLQVVSL